jgi:hypothetical protein
MIDWSESEDRETTVTITTTITDIKTHRLQRLLSPTV